MVRRAVHNYYKFFDETLSSTTFIVLIITLLVFLTGFIVPHANAFPSHLKANILEETQIPQTVNILEINGEKYEVTFSKI